MAYEQALQGEKDWVNMLIAMGATGSCSTCAKLATPPCSETACKLAGSSAADILVASSSFEVPLSGSSVLKICDVSTLISSSAGVRHVIGGPAKVLDPAPVSTIATACTTTIASEGMIQCGAGAQKINYTTCIDHNTGGATNPAGATSSGACSGGACAASTTDVEDPTVTNGGACLTLTSVAGFAGDAYINQVLRIALHAPGSDCLDDPTSFGRPQNIPLTSGTAEATVRNADNNGPASQVVSSPPTGSGFDCATIKRGDAEAVRLVGAFPSVNGLEPLPGVLVDSVVGVVLQCE